MADNVLKGIINVTAPGVENTFNKVAAAAIKTNDSLKKLAPATNSANLALINTGRVIQDLPFGFLGIANNLNPLLESFQRLKAETGSNATAFASLGKSLAGPGGLGFALSIVSSLLIVFGDKLFGSKRAAEENKQALDALNATLSSQKTKIDALSDSLDLLNKLNKIQIEIGFAKGGDLLGMKGEVLSKSDELFELRNQIKNLDTLNEQKKKERDDDVINETQYNEQTKAINGQRSDFWKKEIKLENDIALLRAQIRLQKKRDHDKDLADYEKYVNDIISRGKELAGFFKDFKIVPTFSIFDTKSEQFKKALKIIGDSAKGSLVPTFQAPVKIEPIFAFETGFVKKAIETTFRNFNTEFVNNNAALGSGVKFAIRLSPQALANEANNQAFRDAAKQLTDTFNAAILQGFQGGFEAVGEGIGNILSGKSFGTALFGVLGSLLEDIGKALIKFGLIQKGIQKILENPLLPGEFAIALGVSAIAIGSLIKNIKGARAFGGPVMAGGSYLVGERGPEIFTPNTGGQIIPNNKLGGGSAAAGGMAVVVSGEFVLRGQNLLAAIALANQSKSRLQ